MPDSPLDQYGILIDNSPVAMALYDRDMRLVHLNAEYARLSRLDVQEARGKVLYEVAPATEARRRIHEAVLAGESIDETSVPYKFPGDLRPTCSDIRYRPLRDADGNVVGIVSTVIDVTEGVAAQQELQELLGHKDDFLDLSAHELRTPITVIKAFAQLAQRPEFNHQLPWLEHAFEVISKHADHLAHLVNDMIEVSRIGRGPLPLYTERFDLRGLVNDLENDYAPLFARCTYAIDLPDGPVIVEADRNRIGAVFANIIENADKYASEHAPCNIRIAVETAGEEAIVSIRDKGIGIPLGEQERVFERFFRASNAGTRVRNGLGLGLYIGRSIVEQHGGRIWLESAEGRGTALYFALPLAPGRDQSSLEKR